MDPLPWDEVDVQFYEGSEIVLQKLKKGCLKNPGHQNFIPVHQFTIEKLPAKYRDPDIYDLIKVTSDLTVRIHSPYVSLKRPTFLPGSTSPYSRSAKKGKVDGATGTGRVWEVLNDGEISEDPEDQMFTDADEYNETSQGDTQGNASSPENNSDSVLGARQYRPRFRTCPCKTCKSSDTPSKQFVWVKVITARHVVFNNKEAERATCRLFFDEENKNKTSENVLLTVVEMVTLNPELDWCWLRCVTCDLGLASRLKDLCKRRFDLWMKVNEKFSKLRDENNLTVIVSHPHGCSKQISIGDRVDIEVVKTEWTKYYYTTATCPGSSGATVIMLGYVGTDDHVHSGGKVVKSSASDRVNWNYNYSASGDDYWKLPAYKTCTRDGKLFLIAADKLM
ncbi:hypothetical protein Btru_039724 [Bulinus truncatus]|nr:hypothetical protein Btru_039724 [Bulinus truncatus]